MKKVFVLFVIMFGSLLALNEAKASEFNKFKGTWEYKVPSAPYDYSKGQFIIAEVDGKQTVTIKFMDGTKVKAQNVSCKDGSIKFSLYVDYNYVSVSCKLSKGKLLGKVDSSEGQMDLTAEKKK